MDIRQFNIPHYLSTLPAFQEMTPAELERLATAEAQAAMPRRA